MDSGRRVGSITSTVTDRENYRSNVAEFVAAGNDMPFKDSHTLTL